MLRTLLVAVVLLGIAVFGLAVRIIFGREKKFLHGHACGFHAPERKTVLSRPSQEKEKTT